MASRGTSSVSHAGTQADPKITWYMLGEKVPTMFGALDEYGLKALQENFSNLVPTTYEESHAYLQNESAKPEGQRDLLREMCMFIVLDIPKDRNIVFVPMRTKQLISIAEGCVMFFPTVDLPPDSFGTIQNRESALLLDEKSNVPPKAKVAMAYFTRVGPELECLTDRSKAIKVDSNPYR